MRLALHVSGLSWDLTAWDILKHILERTNSTGPVLLVHKLYALIMSKPLGFSSSHFVQTASPLRGENLMAPDFDFFVDLSSRTEGSSKFEFQTATTTQHPGWAPQSPPEKDDPNSQRFGRHRAPCLARLSELPELPGK